MRPLIYILGGALAAVLVLTLMRPKQPEPIWETLPGHPGPEVASQGTPGLTKLWTLPDFALTERSGQPLTLESLRGKVWVADFFYTTCPGPCPMMTSRLSDLHQAVASQPDVRLVSITTDPAKDNVEMLKAYANRFKAGERWYFATGEKTAIFRLANEGFRLALAETPGAEEPITHSTKLALVDRTGAVRGFYDGLAENNKKLLDDIQRLLRE